LISRDGKTIFQGVSYYADPIAVLTTWLKAELAKNDL
jgi:hypothetical protein